MIIEENKSLIISHPADMSLRKVLDVLADKIPYYWMLGLESIELHADGNVTTVPPIGSDQEIYCQTKA